MAYRCGPTYVFAATCVVTVDRIGGLSWISVGVMWFFSIALTHGRVIVQGLVRKWGEVNYASYHLVMSVLLTAVLVIGELTAPQWGAVVPAPKDLLSAVWSGLLVAGIGGFAVAIIQPRDPKAPTFGEEYFVARATRDVGVETMDWLFEECSRTNANPILVKAVLVAEALQRPKWFRGIERLLVRLRLARTSGVMQMPSKTPLSDRESITLAAQRFSGVWALRLSGPDGYQTWSIDLGDAWDSVTTHNGDVKFAKSVRDIANYLLSTVSGYWAVRSESEPILLELRRTPGRFVIRGISKAAELSVLELNGKADFSTISAPPDLPSNAWWAWAHEVSSSARTIAVVDRDEQAGMVAHLVDGELSHVEATTTADFQEIIDG